MRSSVRRICSIRAMLCLVLGFASNGWATGFAGGVPWQVGDIVVCFGSTATVGGTCNVLRIVNGSPVLLDQFSDGLLGDTRGVAINNTLHAVVTDNAGGGGSKVVVYSVASLNPNTSPARAIAHTPVNIFTANGGATSNFNNAQAIAVNNAGHIFVGNAGTGDSAMPSIVELNPNGTLASPSALSINPLTLPANCTDTKGQLLSMDLSQDGLSLYLTSKGGSIQKLTLASGTCTPFANFGSGVTLYHIKDIPAGALTGNCKSTSCPSGETVLVVATGFTDPDAAETGETPSPSDPDAVNICTNVNDQFPVSCALLLDTNSNPGLTAPLWQAGKQYFTLGAPILDPLLHLQGVRTAGTSGVQEPTFSETGGTVIDNAAIWTDKGAPGWSASAPFAVASFPGTYIVDSNSNLQTVTTTGISGPTQPTWNTSGTTTDGLVWTDQGAWQANHMFSLGAAVGDATGDPHTVLTAGTSGPGPLTPAGGWNDSGSTTIDNAVIWTNQGAVVAYMGNHRYQLNTLIDVGGHAQQAVEPGTSGGSAPSFSTIGGRTIDGAATWTDQGQEFWHPSFSFGTGAVIVDPAGHVQQVTTAGTSGPSLPTFNEGGTTTDGLVWTDQGLPATTGWLANQGYSLNQFIVDTSSQHVQQVVVGGTSHDGSTPAFSTTRGYTLDGQVVWLDRGVATYQPSHLYNIGDAFSDGTNIQQATAAGSSGGSQPTFSNVATTVTSDNAVVWTDEGALTWQANFNYTATTPATTYIVDPNNHVQQVTTVGTSGPAPPTFNDGGTTMDHTVVWTDQGQRFWHPSPFALNAVIRDAAGHLQEVTTAGTSGPAQPTFNEGGTTTDGLVWTDQGLPATAGWLANQAYSLNQFIVDTSSQHVQQVVVAGTSGSGTPAFSTTGGLTFDGSAGTAVVWIDRGIATYQPSHQYNVGDAFSDGTDIQQATAAGTSSGSPPAFANVATTVTPDNAVVWTDEGVLTWQASFNYTAATPATTYIVDPANHVQQVTTAGISSGSIPSPFNDGGTVIDGLVWMDIGPAVTWTPSTQFPLGTLSVDTNSFLEKVTTVGISTTPSQPVWNMTVAGMTVDGLQWTDQGHLVWQVGHQYFTLGALISDGATHAQKVTEAGTSGASTPTFSVAGGSVNDNAVIWTESRPQWQSSHVYTVGNSDTLILDTNHNVQLVTTNGTSGPSQPSIAGNNPWNTTIGQTTIDGLQWINQANPATSVVARYPVTGTTTLQSLALDPLITDCTLSNCSTTLPTAKVGKFWLGDSQSANFYKLDFATGSPLTFNANLACTGCSSVSGIQGIGIYGGEGSNQPDLTEVLFSSVSSANSQTGYFPLPKDLTNTNSLTLTLYNGTTLAPSLPPFALYASAIPGGSCFTDPAPGVPCTVTTATGNALVWKTDIPLPSTGNLGLSSTQTLAGNFEFPTGNSFSNDVSLDAFYDTTTSVGIHSPGYQHPSSVFIYRPVNANGGQETDFGCTYNIPPAKCFQNPEEISIEFRCSKLPAGFSLRNFGKSTKTPWGPRLQIVQYGPSPLPSPPPAPQCTGSAPNETNATRLSRSSAPVNLQPGDCSTQLPSEEGVQTYRFEDDDNEWEFAWKEPRVPSTSKGQTYNACTFDDTHTATPFCTGNFTVKNQCSH